MQHKKLTGSGWKAHTYMGHPKLLVSSSSQQSQGPGYIHAQSRGSSSSTQALIHTLLPKPESWGRQQAILGSPQHPIYNDKSTSIRETHKSSLIFDSPFVVPLTSTVEKAGVISTEKSMLNPLQRTENTAS
jgi:hypothetical protein